MNRLQITLRRLFGLFGRKGANDDTEITSELEAHIALHIDEALRSGMTPAAARRDALLTLGGLQVTKEQHRDRRRVPLLDALRLDLKYASRGLWRAPTFTAVTVLTIALGSGANAAIFSIFNHALLRPLPVPEPARLVNLSSPGPKTGRVSTSSTFGIDAAFSYPLFRDLGAVPAVFTGVAAHRDFAASVAYQDQASVEEGLLVSGSYFPVLELRPVLGRLLDPHDDRTPGAQPVVVLSHAYWRARFNADSSVVNRTLVVNGQVMTIVGVAPEDFVGTTLDGRPRIFVPLAMAAQMIPGERNPHAGSGAWNPFVDRLDSWLYLFARLTPGMSRAAAERAINIPFATIIRDVELPTQGNGLSPAARKRFGNRRLLLAPGAQGQRPERDELSGVFTLLFCVTGMVVLIACANIANLLLARAASRERDVTVRLSLGATRPRLIVQLLMDSALLATAGSLAGLMVASWTLRGISALVPERAASMVLVEFDGRVLTFTVLLAMGMALMFGLYPALLTTRRNLAVALRGGTFGTRSAARARTVLATAQVALSMTLLVTAGLFVQSLLNVSRVDLGMRIAEVATFRVSPELSGYSPEQAAVFFDRVRQDAMALPGVSSVAVATMAVLSGTRSGSNVTVEGFTPAPDANTSSDSARIGPGYFHTLGIPLLAGREFTRADATGAPKVAIVNEAFARKFNLGRAPIGKRMRPGAGVSPDIEIVGLVSDARHSRPKDPPPPQFFLPVAQTEGVGALTFYVRAGGAAGSLIPAIGAVVRRIDPTIPLDDLRPLTEQVGQTVVLDRLISTLSAGFAVLATLLASIGLYGVLAYNLAQRTRELGLRIALGATVARVWGLAFRQVGQITTVGAGVGAIVALALGRLAQSLLFEVPAFEPIVTAAAALGIAVIAAIAGAIPARRAGRIDPAQALRSE